MSSRGTYGLSLVVLCTTSAYARNWRAVPAQCAYPLRPPPLADTYLVCIHFMQINKNAITLLFIYTFQFYNRV
jgi:hypothetical protein